MDMDRLTVVARLTALTLRDAPWLTPGQAAAVATAVVGKAAPGPGRPSPTPDELDMGDVDGLNDLDPAPGSADENEPEAWSRGAGPGVPASSFHLDQRPLRRQGDANPLDFESWDHVSDGPFTRRLKKPEMPHLPDAPGGPGGPEGPEPEAPGEPQEPVTASSWVRPETAAGAAYIQQQALARQMSATAFFRLALRSEHDR